MNMKRFTALAVTAALIAGLISGCGGGKDGADSSGQKSSAMGRYVEEDMELPLKGMERFINMGKSEEGTPLVFASDSEQIIRYEYGDGKWERTPLKWTRGLIDGEMMTFEDVEETADGTVYVMTADNASFQRAVVKGTGEDGGEKAEIPWLEQKTGSGYPPLVYDFLVDDAGRYWFMDVFQQIVAVIDAESGDTVAEIPVAPNNATSQRVLFQGENGEIAVCTEPGKYTIYDGKTAEEKGTIASEGSSESDYALCGGKGNWYQLSADGISRMKMGNDIEEVIMDGNSGAMGSPLNSVQGIVSGDEDDFYAVYMQTDTENYSLKHYVYDKNVAAVPEKTLKVFGLAKSDTVQQAITGFQKENPDVKVEYNMMGKAENEVMTDDIRTLNTELLSGNGADVLMLDGLPLDSYVEKGILKDISGLASDIMGGAEYMEKIMKSAAEKDGKVYGLPVKFSVPLIFGGSDRIEALGSLEKLEAYLEANGDGELFGSAGYDYIRDVFFLLYQGEVIQEDGKVDQEALTRLLEAETKVAEMDGAEDYNQYVTMESSGSASEFAEGGEGSALLTHKGAAGTTDVGSLGAMMIPYAVMRQAEVQPQSIQNMYTPQGIVGINAASEQTETAEQFVKYLFSEEVQSAALTDGFPVFRKALEAKASEAEEAGENYSAGMVAAGDDGTDVELMATYPTAEEVTGLLKICDTLDKPLTKNRVVWNIYQEEADKYLEGSVTADEAAENIARKVDTYLAE